MLSVLHIENVAIIEQAEITFDPGLNVLTGETGAGKSIVIDALGAVLGCRTSRELIRTGAQSASVSAVFAEVPAPVDGWLAENGLPGAEGGELSVRREMHADGRNVCRVGGRPATVAQLRELGTLLVSVSGQNDSYTLLSEGTHLEHLDRFARLDTDPYRAAFERLNATRRERDSLQMDEADKLRRMDALRYAIDELEAAELDPAEEGELNERRTLLRHSAKLRQAAEEAYASVFEEDDAACTQLGRAVQALRAASGVSRAVAALCEQLEELRLTAEGLAEELGGLREEFDFSPDEQDEVEGRLHLLSGLKRKYGGTVDAALAYLRRSREELDAITFSEERLERLAAQERAEHAEALRLARRLTQQRVKAAEALRERITGELASLDMGKVIFEVRLDTDEDNLTPAGADSPRFLISTNVGEPLKPIAKVASGGELARILLALKNVLADGDEALVFDEVDAGVSGRAAQRVAEKLSDAARRKQVLSVTHLPQIAAMADSHFRIEKGVVADRTVTGIHRLDYPGRVEELARLLAGAEITETTRRSARELIDSGAEYKKRRTMQ